MTPKMKTMKPEQILPYFEEEIAKHGTITLVDGRTYYEKCGVGCLFYYVGKECVELPSFDASKLLDAHAGRIKIISRSSLDGDSMFPIKKGC
jgi:hypothetical protein